MKIGNLEINKQIINARSFVYILQEAANFNLDIEIIDRDFVALALGDHKEYLVEELPSITTATAFKACKNKNYTRILLQKAGISAPKGSFFLSHQLEEAINFVESEISFPIVVKPADGKGGEDVFADIKNVENFRQAWQKITLKNKELVVEEFCQGEEYRVFATRKKAFSVIKRIPANVVGDGTSTIAKLIEIKNSDPMRNEEYPPLFKIIVDDSVISNLEERGKNLDSVLLENEQVFLRKTSNISTGGDSLDCSEIADSSVFEIAAAAIRSVPGLAYGGVDLISRNISQNQHEAGYHVIEINGSPGISLHQRPAEGKGYNIAREIIFTLFPELKNQEK